MSVLVDTPVWSLALRRGAPQDGPEVRELRALLVEGRVVMMGPIRQELLSGSAEKPNCAGFGIACTPSRI